MLWGCISRFLTLICQSNALLLVLLFPLFAAAVMTIWFANAKTPPHHPAVIFGGRFFLLLPDRLAIVGKYLFLSDYALHSTFDMCRSHGQCFCLKPWQLRFQI